MSTSLHLFMNYHDQFRNIIHSLSSQNNEDIQQAQLEYLALLNDLGEEFAFLHFDFIQSENNNESLKAIVLLGSYFSILLNQKTPISENSYQEIQTVLFSLFEKENYNHNYYSIISNVILKAARYFKDNWSQLPEDLYQLIIHPNPLISANATQCLSDCINEDLVDITPFYDDVIDFIQISLSEPNESTTITIIPTLRLFYSIADFINEYEQNETYIEIVNLIPNYLQHFQNESIMINDLFLFSRYHQNLFCNSYQNFFEVLMSIIDDSNFSSGIQNASIYCLFAIIENYSPNFYTKSCSLFDFFITKLSDEETYDAAIYSIIHLSEMYGKSDQYCQHLYSFFKRNIPHTISYISLSISYRRIEENLADKGIANEVLNDFLQGFTSDQISIRIESFQFFWPLIEIFHESGSGFDSNELALLLLRIIPDEEELNALAVEVKTLSKLLKFYAFRIDQNILAEVVYLLDFLIENCQDQTVIIHSIQCYRFISTAAADMMMVAGEEAVFLNDLNFSFLCEFFDQIIIENQLESELSIFCMKSLPFFKSSFPEDSFNSLLEFVFHSIFDLFDENEEEEGFDSIILNEKPSIIQFFLRCIENDTILNSPDILERIKRIAFGVFEEKPDFEFIDESIDLDLAECCVIIPARSERKNIVISYTQMAMYKNALALIIRMLESYSDSVEVDSESVYELATDLFNSYLRSSLFPQIFSLELIVTKEFPPDEGTFMDMVELTLDKDRIGEYDESGLKKLCELLFECIKCSVEKWNENTEIIEKVVEFALHALVCLEVDSVRGELLIDFALVLRESFRNYERFSVAFFDKLIFNVIYEIQSSGGFNKVIASIVFADFAHFCQGGGEIDWPFFFELFTSFYHCEDVSVKVAAIFGIAVITTPNNGDAEALMCFVGSLVGDLQAPFDTETCSMAVFAFLRIFQSFSTDLGVSAYLPMFWRVLDAESFRVPVYCVEYLKESLVSFDSNFGDQIPEEKVHELCIVIQKVIGVDRYCDLDEQLKSILMKYSSE